MSDDLDDFFAKKDKKGKKKTKGITSENFVQKYEFKCKEIVKENKKNLVLTNLDSFMQDDGEWKDFVDDEQKDYTDLKIRVLNSNDEEQEREDSESISKEPTDMPWAKKKDEATDEEVDQNDEDNEDANQKTQNDSSDKTSSSKQEAEIDFVYLLKNRKNLANERNNKGPKIDDAAEFPDLGATPEAIEDAKTYQTVKNSSQAPPPSQVGPRQPVTTGNKYNLLFKSMGKL